MSDKLEEIMKRIHVYLANCEESPYSEKELIVSKERIFALLEELNYAVYGAMEDYELTESARQRGIAQVERKAAEIREEAIRRSEQIHAASLLNTQDVISDMKSVLKYMQEKVRVEYELLLMNYDERLNALEKASLEIVSQLQTMNDVKYYLQLIDEIKLKYKKREELTEELETNEMQSQDVSPKNVGSVGNSINDTEEYVESVDKFENKVGGSIVVAVHDTPKVPTGFKKQKKKKKGKDNVVGETQITSQELDAEYFAFQQEQQELGEQASIEIEKEEKGWKEAFRRFGFGNKKE